MSKLDKLIQTLQHQIDTQDERIKLVKYPDKLILALQKLHKVIGLPKIKDNIADQVIFLIANAQEHGPSKYMLNTVLCGPPGVGKTKIGIILAEIWYGLGYIDTTNSTTTTTYTQWLNNPNMSMIWLIIVLAASYVLQLLAFIYHKIGLFYLAIAASFIILVVLILCYCYYYHSSTSTTTQTTTDNEIIKIVSRKDFVAEYVGQTAIKTQTLLDNHRGKVLFIDEAYSLLNDERDAYGKEAITVLNEFMSLHPDEIVVIFAGYKDKMYEGIFTEQPGFPRRCIWNFDCPGYSGPELYDIFTQQLHKDNWFIHNEDKEPIKQLICQHTHMFPSFGGDTERLSFYSKLNATNEAFHSGNKINHTLTLAQVNTGLNLLKENTQANSTMSNKPASPNGLAPNKPTPQLSTEDLQRLAQLLHTYRS